MVLYAGFMKAKWAINSAFMAFYAFASVLVCWCIWGYEVAFGEQMLPIAGFPKTVLLIDDQLQQAFLPAANLAPNFPLSTMVYFQFAFAAITVVLLAGGVLGRMNFYAWMIVSPFPSPNFLLLPSDDFNTCLWEPLTPELCADMKTASLCLYGSVSPIVSVHSHSGVVVGLSRWVFSIIPVDT